MWMPNGVSSPYVLQAQGISKNYGKIQALAAVDFAIGAGEVVGLVGDNGAGKSTLIKVLSGAIMPDAGELQLKGENVRLKSPADARRRGIETVYQDLSLAPHLTIADNLFLGREMFHSNFSRMFGVLNRKHMMERAQQILDELHVTVRSMKSSIAELSGGQRQAVAVARAVLWGDSMIILDEPTNHLGVEEVEMVLNLIRRVRERGIPVVFISHTLPHVLEVTDRIEVMFLGRKVKSLITKDTTLDEVIAYITGSRVA
ncbi:sugar ABC transporter ATP-binding protein [Ferroacidibacillus organovorans]|uniref:Sugar ABC transporter ATP-binding protein n=2 Tax=Ferroacidibacillus organovorans TaxID=1765683 RepID=A0A853KE70_9BACL|nr:sugar ABC transporter ATP-binding protein [Ferroacidibacillus organovorans]OAG95187.1 sugar ABC transporter ATP-binding protein [Ferroacidibacillus organovorans]